MGGIRDTKRVGRAGRVRRVDGEGGGCEIKRVEGGMSVRHQVLFSAFFSLFISFCLFLAKE